ncbi:MULTISPECIES: hypothetical protein [unclassified Moorena]|nr:MULTISPECIES: hypothetical protein [unclassified Moorena]
MANLITGQAHRGSRESGVGERVTIEEYYFFMPPSPIFVSL